VPYELAAQRRAGLVGGAGRDSVLHGSEPPIPITAPALWFDHRPGPPRLTFVSQTVRTGADLEALPGTTTAVRGAAGSAGRLLGRWQSRGQGFESPQLHRVDQDYPQVRALISPCSLGSNMESAEDRLTPGFRTCFRTAWIRRARDRLLDCQRRADEALSRFCNVGPTAATWASMGAGARASAPSRPLRVLAPGPDGCPRRPRLDVRA
jgi:hypothetical protein